MLVVKPNYWIFRLWIYIYKDKVYYLLGCSLSLQFENWVREKISRFFWPAEGQWGAYQMNYGSLHSKSADAPSVVPQKWLTCGVYFTELLWIFSFFRVVKRSDFLIIHPWARKGVLGSECRVGLRASQPSLSPNRSHLLIRVHTSHAELCSLEVPMLKA